MALLRPLISMGLASSIKISSADCKCRVTLLIPRRDWNLLEKRKRRLQKSSAELLEFLLKRHQRGNEKLLFANHQKLPILYQDKGLGLRRSDFEVDSFIWHQFKALARFYNVSMCRLFVDFLRIFGTPSKNGITLRVQLYEKLQILSKTALSLYKTTCPAARHELGPTLTWSSYNLWN